MKNLYYLFILSFLLISCEEDIESTNPNDEVEDPTDDVDELNAKVSGYVQKGPFLSGSDLIIYELDSNLNQTGKSFSTKIEDNKGTYDFGDIVFETDLVKVIADGYYFNEVLGSNSTSRLSLNHISKISDQNKININILTSLSSPRIEYLMKNGMTFQESVLKSKSEILNIFKIQDVSNTQFQELDLIRSDILLAISTIIQGFRKDAEVSELIQNMATDLKEDGVINSSITMSKLLSHASFICIDQVKNNLKNKYEEMGQNISLPGFEKFITEFDKDTVYERNHLPISYPKISSGRDNILNLDDTLFDPWMGQSIGANILGGGKLKIEVTHIQYNPRFGLYGIPVGGQTNSYIDNDETEIGNIDVFSEINSCGDSVFISAPYVKNTFKSIDSDEDFIFNVNINAGWDILKIDYYEMCSETPTISRIVKGYKEFVDEDNDGIHEGDDYCAQTPIGASVDANGCVDSQKDTDGDGVNNNLDICPCTTIGEPVTIDGCSLPDTDNDTLYYGENGVTIHANPLIQAGTEAFLDGVKYTIVDRDMLISMVQNDDDLSKVVTTLISNMSQIFKNNSNFNQDISSWDVSNVTDMYFMFDSASSYNQSLESWDVSNVTRMAGMFNKAFAFNQDISDWDVSNVTNMGSMFENSDSVGVTSFNQNLSNWNVVNCSVCSRFRLGANSFILPIPNFTNCNPD